MYKVSVSEDSPREITFTDNRILIDGKENSWDIIAIDNRRFHILKDNQSFTTEIIKADYEKKVFEIKVNGNHYTVAVKDRFDELLQKLGMENSASPKINVIRAPMPGLVLRIMVEAGQELKPGESILLLEAMKMENVIKSPGEGKIKAIKIKESDAVEKNQVLIELE
ncbi:MAG: acetyl-CoA carboxylase biotin carboxyl carrier protein subunit [Chitinophagales bacterium]|nr:acetyl-CoA carboxylase biotin carboxyl carrier protein subunit [Chitinophagales bacterium]